MVIFEGSISQRVFFDKINKENTKARKDIVQTLSKICAFAMFAYLFMQLLVFVHGQHYDLLNTKMGYWFLLEMLGFVPVSYTHLDVYKRQAANWLCLR